MIPSLTLPRYILQYGPHQKQLWTCITVQLHVHEPKQIRNHTLLWKYFVSQLLSGVIFPIIQDQCVLKNSFSLIWYCKTCMCILLSNINKNIGRLCFAWGARFQFRVAKIELVPSSKTIWNEKNRTEVCSKWEGISPLRFLVLWWFLELSWNSSFHFNGFAVQLVTTFLLAGYTGVRFWYFLERDETETSTYWNVDESLVKFGIIKMLSPY